MPPTLWRSDAPPPPSLSLGSRLRRPASLGSRLRRPASLGSRLRRPASIGSELERQLNLAKAANRVSILSKGIMVMSRNFHQVINLDLKDWLVKQIRRELSRLMENKLNSSFSYINAEAKRLEASLKTLSSFILSQSHMMELLQDLLNINGYQIWEEVFTEVMDRCTEREYAEFINMGQISLSLPASTKELPKVQTVFGCLLCQILQLTDPSQSMFIEPMSGWFDAVGHELLGVHFFDLLYSCVGQVGLASLDLLLSVLVKKSLEHAMRVSEHLLDARCLEDIHKLEDSLGPATSLPLFGSLSIQQMINMTDESWAPWTSTLAFIGQLQLLRCLVSLKLKSASKVKAEAISYAAEGLITSIYSQIETLYKCLRSGEDDATIRCFLEVLNKQQTLCGLFSPLQTLYITEDPPTLLGRFAFVFSIAQLEHYVLDTHLGALTSRSKKYTTDFSPVVIGLGTFLHQFHPSVMNQYLQYMGQYIRTTAAGAFFEAHIGFTDISSEIQKSVVWLMYFCKYMDITKDVEESCIPPSLVAILQT